MESYGFGIMAQKIHRIDKIKRPYFVESPALMLLYTVLSLQGIIIIGVYLLPKCRKSGGKIC